MRIPLDHILEITADMDSAFVLLRSQHIIKIPFENIIALDVVDGYETNADETLHSYLMFK